MGTGKTTVGRLVARQLEHHWIDLDEQIERDSGLCIATIFETKGEAYFRAYEVSHLRQYLTSHSSIVISTGGGIIETDAGRRLLCDQSNVVWLTGAFNQVLARLSDEAVKKRPLLNNLNKAEQLYERRKILYKQCATFEVNIDHKTPFQVAEMIINRYR